MVTTEVHVNYYKKGKGQGKGQRTGNTDATTCKNCGRIGRWGERLLETGRIVRTTTPTTTHTKAGTTRKVRAKANNWTWCKRISLPKQPQLSRILHRHQVLLKLFDAIQTHTKKDGS